MTLDDWLHRWAAWCETGRTSQQVVSWLRERRGVYQSGAAFESETDSIEYRIEKAVSELAQTDRLNATIIRMEYQRKTAKETQAQRAIRLRLGLRAYKSRLKKARDYVSDSIGL